MNKALFFKLTSTFSFVTGSSVTLFSVRGFSDNCSTFFYTLLTKDIEGRCNGWLVGCGTEKNLTCGAKTWTTSWKIENSRSSADNPSIFLIFPFWVEKLSVSNAIRVPEGEKHPVYLWNFISSDFFDRATFNGRIKVNPENLLHVWRIYFSI